MINFTNLTDPTYNQPITNVFHQGTTFRIDTSDRKGPTVTFKDLQWVIENGARLKQRIQYYEKLIAEGGSDKETNLARSVIECAKRHSLVYDRIYIPLLTVPSKPVPEKTQAMISPPTVSRQAILSTPAVSSNGQFSLF